MAARARSDSAFDVALCGLLAADLGLALAGRSRARRITKTGLMPLLAARVLAGAGSRRPGLRGHVLAALLLSSAGDASVLDESSAALTRGAVCFGAAQLCYVRGFRRAGSRPRLGAGTAVVLAAAVGVGGYWPRAGALRPVLIGYPPLLTAMAVGASGLGAALPADAARRIAAGARLFLVSDTFVGAQRFLELSGPQRVAFEVPTMLTYVGAQWLIADGAVRATRG